MMKPTSTFEPDDQRNFNRHGEAFDMGETFAGVPFEVGLADTLAKPGPSWRAGGE